MKKHPLADTNIQEHSRHKLSMTVSFGISQNILRIVLENTSNSAASIDVS